MTTQPILVTSRANARVKQLRAAFAGHARLSGGLVAIEGENLLREALDSGLPLKTDLPQRAHRAARVASARRRAAGSRRRGLRQRGRRRSTRKALPPCSFPRSGRSNPRSPRTLPATKSALLLVAAGLQDPGNLGTLIRSAEAFGATAVLTTAGTVSEWNQKALRASAGSVFRVPVVQVAADQLLALKSRGVRLLAAVAPNAGSNSGPHIGSKSNSKATRNECVVLPATETDLACACALMIGNEGAGLSAEFLALADARITIPTPGRVESLNAAVAGSLLLYEASRQRTRRISTLTTCNSTPATAL